MRPVRPRFRMGAWHTGPATVRLRLAAVLAAALAGCLALPAGAAQSATAQAATASQPTGCNPDWPVVAHLAGGQAVTLPTGSQLPVACASATGYATSESTIALSDGVLVYSPAETENS